MFLLVYEKSDIWVAMDKLTIYQCLLWKRKILERKKYCKGPHGTRISMPRKNILFWVLLFGHGWQICETVTLQSALSYRHHFIIGAREGLPKKRYKITEHEMDVRLYLSMLLSILHLIACVIQVWYQEKKVKKWFHDRPTLQILGLLMKTHHLFFSA